MLSEYLPHAAKKSDFLRQTARRADATWMVLVSLAAVVWLPEPLSSLAVHFVFIGQSYLPRRAGSYVPGV